MAKTLATTLTIALGADYRNALDLNTVRDSLAYNIAKSLATGTAANQADRSWHDTRTLTGTSEELDLAGVLTDGFGATLTFVKIKAIVIQNKNTTAAANLAIGGAAANGFINWVANATDIVNIGPGGVLVLYSPVDGYGVTAATGDLLKINSGAATISYDIAIIGTSA